MTSLLEYLNLTACLHKLSWLGNTLVGIIGEGILMIPLPYQMSLENTTILSRDYDVITSVKDDFLIALKSFNMFYQPSLTISKRKFIPFS